MKDTNKTTRSQQSGRPALILLLPQREGRDEGGIKQFTNQLIATIILCWAWTAIPANAQTQQLNIPAQALDNALTELADTANLKLLYQSAVVSNKKSHAVSGNYTPKQALDILLGDTGLQYRSTGVNAITVEKNPAINNSSKAVPVKNTPEPQSDNGSDTTLEKVTVEADSAYDPEYYADPYNKDYVLPNATAGTKTDTPIMETPLNVQVISKQVLKDQQVIRLTDSLKNVSGVTTNSSNSIGFFGGKDQNIFLRGFASETFFRNGFRLQQGSASRELANVESVEVLKGPAAILYGLVEPGGMVNVVTKQPLATPYYGFTQQFGSYDLYRTTLDASGPLTKNKDLLYRTNLSYENSGSFRDFVGREDVFFAPVLRWNISPQTQITFEMEYNHLHKGLDGGFIPVIPGQNLNTPISRNYDGYSPSTTETIFGGFNWSHQFNDDWTLKHSFSVNQQSFKTPFSGNASFAGDKAFLQSVLGATEENPIADQLLDALPDGSYVGRIANSLEEQKNTTSTNLDLVGHFDTSGLKHTLLLGGDYYRLDTTINQGFPIGQLLSYVPLTKPNFPATPIGPFHPDKFTTFTDQYGLYIQDQIKLPYDIHVTGGIRYQYIHQGESSKPFGGTSTSSSAPAQDAVTPRVGILWHPKNWVSLYANYAESFGPQFNNPRSFVSDGVGKLIGPTSAAQYEGGMKFSFFNGKLRTSLTYFDLTKTNLAAGDPNRTRDCGTGIGNCFVALGEVRSRGPEIDIQGEILPGWNVIATWTNTDIKVTKANPGIQAASGASFNPGSRLPNVPRNTGRLWSSYEVQDGDYKGLTFGGGVTLRDSQLAPDAYGAALPSKIPGYATFDLMAGYSRQIGDAKVSIQLNIDNLLDKQYFSSATTCNVTCQGKFVDFGTPRTFMGQVSVQY